MSQQFNGPIVDPTNDEVEALLGPGGPAGPEKYPGLVIFRFEGGNEVIETSTFREAVEKAWHLINKSNYTSPHIMIEGLNIDTHEWEMCGSAYNRFLDAISPFAECWE